jgi:hypothetical protein
MKSVVLATHSGISADFLLSGWNNPLQRKRRNPSLDTIWPADCRAPQSGPNARIIDARHELISCCLSNLKQLFANGQKFSYSIEDVARYYWACPDLMEH